MSPQRRDTTPALLGLAAVLAVTLVAGVAAGAVRVGIIDVVRALAGRGEAVTIEIVRALRLPRVTLAALVGSALGVAGAALQGVTRNPLAEPYLLGVSGGAAVGGVLVAATGGGALAVGAGAFLGALTAVIVALGVARAAGGGGGGDNRVLLMAGVVVGALANAVIMIALAHAPPFATRGALSWMMGSVADADWLGAGWLAATVGVGGLLLMAWAPEIDVLALGDDPAAALGLDVSAASRRVFVVASLVAAASVAAAGLVGFVGLIVPHLARAMGLRGHRAVLAGAALGGAAIVVAADLLARTIRAPAELPLGAVTALVGVPFFLWRLRAAA